jgi:hypothetical protein
MKTKFKRLTKKRIEELNRVGGYYMKWVALRNQYSEAALLRHGLLKVQVPFSKKKA